MAMVMPDWLLHILYPITGWLHIVCTTLIVGGTLFYELVVPIACEELRPEQQLYVFARARWVFRWVVWVSAALLVGSGLVMLWRMWPVYHDKILGASFRWGLMHMGLGAMGLVIALLLTIGRSPPAHPIRWMRINLVILLVVIFVASVTRHVRLTLSEKPSGEPMPGSLKK